LTQGPEATAPKETTRGLAVHASVPGKKDVSAIAALIA
jgi:hypothetical protein